MTCFIDEQNVIFSGQYGFLKGRSTEHAMLDIAYKITDAIENKKLCLGLFLDLSKAFDTISHSILIDKLFKYGIRGVGLKWFQSYLTNRSQYVDTGFSSSTMRPVTNGVPQGSVLGPLLFLFYINDMPLSSPILSFILFADDTTGIYSSPTLDELFLTVNKEIENLQVWFNSNKLLINATKTHLVTFMTHQKQKYVNSENHSLLICHSSLKPTTCAKFLGLQLDSNLSFKNHFSFICSKISKGIYAIKRASSILEKKDLITLYYALIYPYLSYGLLVWGGICKLDTHFRKLHKGPAQNHMKTLTTVHKLQKRALRTISKQGYLSHHIPLCHTLQILDLEQLYDMKALSFLHDYYHDKLPPLFNDKFSFYNNRNNELCLKIRYRRTDIASAALYHTLPNIWNPLPNQLKAYLPKSKRVFLREVKSHFLQTYENWLCDKTNCFVCNS